MYLIAYLSVHSYVDHSNHACHYTLQYTTRATRGRNRFPRAYPPRALVAYILPSWWAGRAPSVKWGLQAHLHYDEDSKNGADTGTGTSNGGTRGGGGENSCYGLVGTGDELPYNDFKRRTRAWVALVDWFKNREDTDIWGCTTFCFAVLSLLLHSGYSRVTLHCSFKNKNNAVQPLMSQLE